ncbi:MAG: hypothetical protein FWE33_02325 [Defluviitaleaceae bacterium]|nr:hypothetical protein [Defluviitaleaceae bacterium]
MKLVFGTTNAGKIEFIKRRVEGLGVEILCLNDVNAPKLHIEECGNSPLENAKIKTLAYYDVLRVPLFSADSGLYIDGLDNARQPGINVRGEGDWMDDEQTIAHYSALAAELGGKMKAQYKNAICLIDKDGVMHEYMGDDIASEPFYLVEKPHTIRRKGFPLDSLSVDIASGMYYDDLEDNSKYYMGMADGFAEFFKRVLGL